MRSAERTLRDEACVTVQLARYGVYLRRLKAFGQREWRQDGGQALGEHRLAAARWSYHDTIITDFTGS